MNKIKILYITSSFDKKGSASIRNIGLVNGLVQNGCEVHVLTQYWPESMVDASLKKYIDETVVIFRDHIKVIDAYFGNFKSNKQAEKQLKNSKIVHVVKKAMRDFVFFPDIDREWIKCYRKNLNYKEYDLIISSSDTKTAHFIGRDISKKYKKTWYTFWGDPWEDDMGTTGIKKKIAKIYEKKFLAESDCVFYTSKPTLEAMQKKYSHLTNLHFLRRAYLEKILSVYNKSNKVTLCYPGSIYYGRKIEELFEKISLYNTQKNSKYQIELNIYGIYPDKMKDEYQSDCIHFFSHVDYAKVNEVIRNSDAVVMVMNDSASHQIPGKLFDYFGTDKSIVVLACEKENEVEQFIQSTHRCLIFRNGQINIDEIIRDIQKHEHKPLEDYSVKTVAKSLLDFYGEK